MPPLIVAVTVPICWRDSEVSALACSGAGVGADRLCGGVDLGIGRATTQRVSALRDGHQEGAIPDVVATATRLTRSRAVGMLLIMLAAWLG